MVVENVVLTNFRKQKKAPPVFTNVACRFLNIQKCKCKVYDERKNKKSDCLILSPKNIDQLVNWLPTSCSYRLIFEKKELPFWHHLKKKIPIWASPKKKKKKKKKKS